MSPLVNFYVFSVANDVAIAAYTRVNVKGRPIIVFIDRYDDDDPEIVSCFYANFKGGYDACTIVDSATAAYASRIALRRCADAWPTASILRARAEAEEAKPRRRIRRPSLMV